MVNFRKAATWWVAWEKDEGKTRLKLKDPEAAIILKTEPLRALICHHRGGDCDDIMKEDAGFSDDGSEEGDDSLEGEDEDDSDSSNDEWEFRDDEWEEGDETGEQGHFGRAKVDWKAIDILNAQVERVMQKYAEQPLLNKKVKEFREAWLEDEEMALWNASNPHGVATYR